MRRTLWMVLGAVALAGAGLLAFRTGVALAPPPERVGTVLDQPQPTADLALRSTEGRVEMGGVAARADWTLVFFGFVDCPDVCPMTMSRLADTYRELGEPSDLQVVMVTVDPERDDPARLERYVDGFHPSFMGLGGSSEDVAAAAERFFIGYNGTGEGIAHTEAVALLDAEARLRVVYTQGNLHGLQRDLSSLLNGGRL
ncbi:MAG: SCO family protein [Trueperaceae bacterium]|nr:SCO family protein [Trueperaceae bacterium]